MSAIRRSRTPLLVAAMAIATAIAGCNGDGDDPQTNPTTPSEETTSSLTPTPTGPLAGYTDEEVAAYRAAIDVVKRGRRVQEQVYRTARATPTARRAFESAYTGDYLDTAWGDLEDAEAAGLYTRGRSLVRWAKPLRILVSDSGGTVDLRACIDNSDIRVFRRGDGEVDSSASKAAAYKVTVDRVGGDEWRVSRSEETGEC